MQDALDTGTSIMTAPPMTTRPRRSTTSSRSTGQELHLSVTDFTSIGKSSDTFAFGVGGLASGMMNAVRTGIRLHRLLEVDANVTYGGIGGFSYALVDGLYAGLTAKSSIASPSNTFSLHRRSSIIRTTSATT